ncbi:uncharacterized protein LOC131218084 [Magnolia sinica]|uniref:uncharacterized protein LOC131218084 n=1 Tax=Magnolia sinica TaxID=86752 RepID=UPI00265B2C3F|nr:uncharacterized protein LOC131218084 [Magnolia sinica]
MLISLEWLEFFPLVSQIALPGTTSDHCPVFLAAEDQNRGPKLFRFEISWTKIKGYTEMAADWWDGFTIEGYAGYRLCCKLRMLKEKIKQWKQFELHKRALELEVLLEDLQALDVEAEARIRPSDFLSRCIQIFQALFARGLEKEVEWKQRSQVRWIKEGDRNTKFFHAIASMNARRNRINSIVVDGSRIEDRVQIAEEAICHFKA